MIGYGGARSESTFYQILLHYMPGNQPETVGLFKGGEKKITEYFKLHCLSEIVIITGQQGVANVSNDGGPFPHFENNPPKNNN